MSVMLNKKIIESADFKKRDCVLVSYELPLLKHCFTLCADYQNSENQVECHDCDYEHSHDHELMVFFMQQAEKLAQDITGNPQSYLIAFSGNQVRKRSNFHIHLFIIEKRWQKARVYSILAGKNCGQVIYEAIKLCTPVKSIIILFTKSTKKHP